MGDGQQVAQLKQAAGRLKAACRAATLATWKEWRAGMEAQLAGKLQVSCCPPDASLHTHLLCCILLGSITCNWCLHAVV